MIRLIASKRSGDFLDLTFSGDSGTFQMRAHTGGDGRDAYTYGIVRAALDARLTESKAAQASDDETVDLARSILASDH